MEKSLVKSSTSWCTPKMVTKVAKVMAVLATAARMGVRACSVLSSPWSSVKPCWAGKNTMGRAVVRQFLLFPYAYPYQAIYTV